VPLSNAEVVDDWGVMLNQTNIKQNNNKFYVIQLLKTGSTYHVYTRWGRVGEPGQNACKAWGANLANAQKEWISKFRAKTKNDWNTVRV
jgi:poly [ADP-ribose] polymerase